MQHVYSRSSIASQSLLRQQHILAEARLPVSAGDVTGGCCPEGAVKLYQDPATTSKFAARQRPVFGEGRRRRAPRRDPDRLRAVAALPGT